MDYSTEYQQCQQYYQQQQAAAAIATAAYDPSQTQAYYTYNQQQQQYQYYPSQDYARTSYPQPTSVQHPGFPIPSDPTHLQNQQNTYYSDGIVDNQSQPQSNLTQFSDAAQKSGHQAQILCCGPSGVYGNIIRKGEMIGIELLALKSMSGLKPLQQQDVI